MESKLAQASLKLLQRVGRANLAPVLEIGFSPPTEDFGSIWSSQKAHKFRHVNFPF